MGASEFRNYPFLNGEEFIEVCHLLDRRYCQTSIGNKRRRWRLDVIRALNVSFSLGPEYNTYLSIIDSIVREPEDGGLSSCLETLSFRGIPSTNDDGLSSSLQALSFQGRQTTDVDMDDDTEMIASEKADEVWAHSFMVTSCLTHTVTQPFVMSGNPTPDPSSETVIGKVKYDIILHPTYQVPCLWFALSGLTTGENPLDIEAVFRYLVPEEYKSRLRSAGPIGGISMDVGILLKFLQLPRS